MSYPSGIAQIKPTGWIISEGKLVRLDPAEFDPQADRGRVKEYRISEIARYLIHPGQIEIRKRLIGCEVHTARNGARRLLHRLFPARANTKKASPRRDTEVLLSGFKLRIPGMQDQDLEAHFKRIADELRGFDPFAKKIARLKTARLSHIIGVCEDIGGGYSYLKLQGSGEDKIRYLTANVGREVRVTLHRAHLSEGLFELRGFPPGTYNPANAFRLCAYTRDGEPAACVLTSLGNLDFRLSDPHVLKYLNLLEHTLKANPELRRAFDSCFLGSGRPLSLFFNKQLEVDYAKANLPEIYRDIFRAVDVDASHRNLVKPVLNFMQTAVSLSYQPAAEVGNGKLFSQISILHDLRALEPLRKSLPAVYAEMSKRAFTAEAGRFYLLDSITGAAHAE
ncbi:MAG: hypothetical protein HY895_21655 [Deltaproteobacteria bacterium]|nr:hypothetical protein [Deltaproteobacteria bacterium]